MLSTYGLNVSEEKLVALCKEYGVKELALFGSRARGDHRSDSDIDLLVEFQPGIVHGLIRLAGLQRKLGDLFGLRVDLVPKKGLTPLVRLEVLPEMKPVYAATA